MKKLRCTPTVAALAVATVLGALITPIAAPEAHAEEPASVDLVDDQATSETRSLFAYLQQMRGKGTLFGHQHTTDYGQSFETRDGVSSDVQAATGDYPAVFGFDTLIIEGGERPGSRSNSREENALALAKSIREAHDLGGVSSLSAHVENLVTGGDFNDTSGDALREVLPGGSKNAQLTKYLDLIALAADNAVDENGTKIPIIFRPWHENAGSWFWWGAAFGNPAEYAELFRYTVEYLRDVKDVHNLLYAFSPGSGFGGDKDLYLRTYPGDDFIDVLGYDTYDASASKTFLDGMVDDLAMMSDLADQKGKISALTEFGITGGVQPDGSNPNLNWYTDVLDAIKANPAAARSAYMLTWANFGSNINPYTPVSGELLPDFKSYHDDPFTLFAKDVTGEEDITTEPVAQAPTLHLASPADGARISTSPRTIRVSAQGYAADEVSVSVDGTDITLKLDAPAAGSLWWTGELALPAPMLDNSTRALTVHVIKNGVEVATQNSKIIAGARPVMGHGVVDDFDGYGDDTALRSEFVQYGVNSISLEKQSVGAGTGALRFDYNFATQSYTGIGKQVTADWSDLDNFELWVDPDASGNKLVLQLMAGGVAFEAYPSLDGDEPENVSIPFDQWRPAAWDTANAGKTLTPELLSKVTQFNVYINAADGGEKSGSVVLDSLRAVPAGPVYTDVPADDPQAKAIRWLHDHVIDLGDAKGQFSPSKSLKDSEVVVIFNAYDSSVAAPSTAKRLEILQTLWDVAGSPAPTAVASYKDVPRSAQAAAGWAIEAGLVQAESSKKFGATKSVSRAEIASWLQIADKIRKAV